MENNRNNLHLKNLKIYFAQYCEYTTIHGMRYIGERGRSLSERLLWIVTLFVACVLSILLIHKTYARWRSSPVVVRFAPQEFTISTIPFPAVTICPEAKFDTEIFNFTEMVRRIHFGDSLTAQEQEYFDAAYSVCSNWHDFHEYQHMDMNRTSIPDRLFHMSPPFDPLNVTTIKWSGEQVTADNVLTRTITSDGICYTFNMIDDDMILRHGYSFMHSSKHSRPPYKWSIEHGYEDGDFDAYPRRSFIPGLGGGLVIESLYTNNSNLDYLCGNSLQGFKMVIHSPLEHPNMRKFIRLSLDHGLFTTIAPKVMMVSQEMWDYSPNERQCYFPTEKYLAIYKYYTLQNCLDECALNFTWMKCGCIPFYFPVTARDVQICGPASHRCVHRSRLKYLEAENELNSAQRCGCLPSCLSINYYVEQYNSPWEWKKMYDATGIIFNTQLDMTDAHLSILAIYYKDLTYLKMVRNELYGLVDFLSGVGGILGLLIGFSVISAIEVLYYFTLRITCNILKYGARGWSGTPDL